MSERVFELLLRLYPRHFRDLYGAGMRQAFHLQLAERRRRGGLAPLALTLRTALGLARGALAEWGEPALAGDWRGDVRYALRALRRSPGFTAVAVLTLALGVGANAAIFSLVDGILLRPLPYPEPERLVLLYQSNPRTGEQLGRVSLEDLQDWGARTGSLSGVAGFVPGPTILTGRGDPLELELTYVTPPFFEVLGVAPMLGRPLGEEDHRLRLRSAVVSHALWREQLGGDPAALGTSLLLRGEPFTVVGVMPPSLRHPTPETAVWVPQSLVGPNQFSNGMPTRGDRYLRAIGRLAPGADAAAAQRELTALSAELAASYPASNADWSAALAVPLRTSIVGDVDRALVVVLAAVGFTLLIGCVNLANLLLARGSARRRELAVRAALGAGRGRIVRQLLTESLVLALVGGLVGLALAYGAVDAVLALGAEVLPRVDDVRVDGRVAGFALLLSAATGIAFGMVPALRLAGSAPRGDMGGRGTTGSEGRRLRAGLVVGEVALAVLLVIGAGLMARSFLALRSVEPGFQPERVLTVSLQLNLTGVPDAQVGSFLVGRREEILERVRALPGVERAGMINVFPLEDGAFSLEYPAAGPDAAPGDPGVLADTRYVDHGYLETMGIPLLAGEPLPVELTSGAPVPVVMSESAARRLWPDADPVGRRIVVPWGESVVVGVVGDVRQVGLSQAPQPAVYFPQRIAPRLLATLVVRAEGDPMALAEPIRQIIKEVDPNQPIRSVASLESLMAESIQRDRFFTLLFAAFGALALGLASVGIYGVLAYAVRQRTQEIGVRLALGARTDDVLRMVAASGMRLVAAGAVLGTLAALALTRVLESQLYGVTPTDPATFAGAVLFLAAVGLAATWVPARRATRVPPMVALRPE